MEASATSTLAALLFALAAFVVGVWWFFSGLNPFWNWWGRLPRSLEAHELDRKFYGLILFGEERSYYYFQETTSGDSFSFSKRSGPGESRMLLSVDSRIPDSDMKSRIERHAALTFGESRTLRSVETDGDFEVVCDDPAVLAALSRALVEIMNHPPSAKYRCLEGGPIDNSAVREFFGLDDHAA